MISLMEWSEDTYVFVKNLAVRKYSSSVFLFDYAFNKFLNLVCFSPGCERNIELSIISIKLHTVIPDDISQG